jgi:hypothetical protein
MHDAVVVADTDQLCQGTEVAEAADVGVGDQPPFGIEDAVIVVMRERVEVQDLVEVFLVHRPALARIERGVDRVDVVDMGIAVDFTAHVAPGACALGMVGAAVLALDVREVGGRFGEAFEVDQRGAERLAADDPVARVRTGEGAVGHGHVGRLDVRVELQMCHRQLQDLANSLVMAQDGVHGRWRSRIGWYTIMLAGRMSFESA